jgi:hypothetical protein
MKTKTRAELIAIQSAWWKRIAEIREDWDVRLAAEGACLQIEIAVVGFILEIGLTPETAEAFIEEKIAEFEKLAISRTTRKSPKRGRWPRRPPAPSP